MTQAEIAGGTVTSLNRLPSKGHWLYDFELPSALGKKILLSDYRGRSNLVLIFADNGSKTTKLLIELARHCICYGEMCAAQVPRGGARHARYDDFREPDIVVPTTGTNHPLH